MPIYIQIGTNTSRLNAEKVDDPFKWLAEYQPQQFDGRLDSFKKNNAKYFISGYIEANENGSFGRNDDTLIRRSLIIMDYDDMTITDAEFLAIINDKLSSFNYIVYPSVSNGLKGKGTRYRLVLQPDRPLVDFEYKYMIKQVSDLVGIKLNDRSNYTWSQPQGLPAVRDKEANKYQVTVNNGELYPVPEQKTIPLPKKKEYKFDGTKSIGGTLSHDEAIEIIKGYVEVDGDNLTDYRNAISAVMVIAKAVMNGEIDHDTAVAACKIIALGDANWADGNISKLYRILEQGNEPRTPYTFKAKFHDVFFSKLDTMAKLKKRLYEVGEEWRVEHTSYNENTGKTKTDLMLPIQVSNMIQQYADLKLIGENADKSPLYIFNHDTGIYDSSHRLINQLIKAVEYRYNYMDWKKVTEHLRTDVQLVPPLKDRYLIAVKNGVFNLKTKQLDAFSPDYHITSKIGTAYNAEAKMPQYFNVHEWFNSLACGDEEISTLLWQMINEAINPNYTRSKVGILVGEGNNGKGTFSKMLINLLGEENISALKPPEFGERFKIANLIGKVANIGDDISNAYIDEISNLMSIATNDTITIEEKGSPAYDVTLSLFCLFSGNDVPKVRNKSQGWYRRLLLVPFNADFNGKVENPDIKNKYINDPKVLEYVLKMAIEYDFERFIEPKAVKAALTDYKKENDYITAYVEDVYMQEGYHKYPKVPIEFVRDDINDYLGRRRINTTLKYHFTKDFVKALNEFSEDASYKIAPQRYNADYINSLPFDMKHHLKNVTGKLVRSISKS